MNTTRAIAGAFAVTAALAASGCASASSQSTVAQVSTSGPASPTAAAPSTPANFDAFAGKWVGHGNDMSVARDGTFIMEERTYQDCSESAPPCDNMSDNIITDGAVAHGKLQTVSGTTATGWVFTTSDPALLPEGTITFDLDPANDEIDALNLNWCGPDAPSGLCD
ncbi:hypothetical protein [Actinospica robiniae]|uniref:hypothetical protein n=1 Tax=Actinospica robiniae TaxID=304901 RepID=UPI000409B6C8|nr:hypothetical protein [Actinospica robiniae]